MLNPLHSSMNQQLFEKKHTKENAMKNASHALLYAKKAPHQSVIRKFYSGLIKELQNNLKTCFALVLPNQYYPPL